MKKSTKGALAAAAAGTLLLGGAGSLAFWTSTTTVNAGSVSSGSIALTSVTCPSGWSHTEAGANPVAVTLIVPGDTIRKTCTGTLTLVGDHIGATVALDPASIASATGTLGTEITATATMTSPAASLTAAGVYPVSINIDVSFPGAAATNGSESSTATLNSLQLVATQNHQ